MWLGNVCAEMCCGAVWWGYGTSSSSDSLCKAEGDVDFRANGANLRSGHMDTKQGGESSPSSLKVISNTGFVCKDVRAPPRNALVLSSVPSSDRNGA